MSTDTPCPKCGSTLSALRYPSDCMLNRDQWESVRAGDYYCIHCSDPLTKTGYAYFWEKDVLRTAENPAVAALTREFTALREYFDAHQTADRTRVELQDEATQTTVAAHETAWNRIVRARAAVIEARKGGREEIEDEQTR